MLPPAQTLFHSLSPRQSANALTPHTHTLRTRRATSPLLRTHTHQPHERGESACAGAEALRSAAWRAVDSRSHLSRSPSSSIPRQTKKRSEMADLPVDVPAGKAAAASDFVATDGLTGQKERESGRRRGPSPTSRLASHRIALSQTPPSHPHLFTGGGAGTRAGARAGGGGGGAAPPGAGGGRDQSGEFDAKKSRDSGARGRGGGRTSGGGRMSAIAPAMACVGAGTLFGRGGVGQGAAPVGALARPRDCVVH